MHPMAFNPQPLYFPLVAFYPELTTKPQKNLHTRKPAIINPKPQTVNLESQNHSHIQGTRTATASRKASVASACLGAPQHHEAQINKRVLFIFVAGPSKVACFICNMSNGACTLTLYWGKWHSHLERWPKPFEPLVKVMLH